MRHDEPPAGEELQDPWFETPPVIRPASVPPLAPPDSERPTDPGTLRDPWFQLPSPPAWP
jgi:hypothetical protein